MKIKKVECDQFAGLSERELEFENGLNVVVGENESGKSTMIELIFQLLFQNTRIDGRKNPDFKEKYFPQKVDGPQGDVIDGEITFETANGKYRLTKEWEEKKGKKVEGTCKLKTPEGTLIKNEDKIAEILSDEFQYGAGVFSEIVFASQRREQLAVESIMGALGKRSEVRDDLKSTLTQAAMETGGVSLEALENRIEVKIKELIGRWDLEADAPEGGAKRASYENAWAAGAGLIVKKYYEADEVRSRQREAEDTEKAVEEHSSIMKRLRLEKRAVETERAEFQKIRGILGQISLLSREITNLEKNIREQEMAFEKWPGISRDIERAESLRRQREQAVLHELYMKVQKAQEAYSEAEKELKKNRHVDPEDIRNLRNLLAQKPLEEGKLAGMNLAAKVRQLGKEPVHITALSDGKEIAPGEGDICITEAVNINIPGVMEMQLMPMGIDVDQVKETLEALDLEIKNIFNEYDIDSVEALQELADRYDSLEKNVQKRKMELERILGDKTWEEVKRENEAVPQDIAEAQEIEYQIRQLCGMKNVDAFIGGQESVLNSYREKYETPDKLTQLISKNKEEKKKAQEKMESADSIPEKFRNIEDEDMYASKLEGRLEDYDKQIELHSEKLRAAERSLGEKTAEEYSEELQQKEEELEAAKREYRHWSHIQEVFGRLKDQMVGNPIEDIEEKFRKYLSEITDGNLQLTAMDESLAEVQMASDAHKLSYNILSDGTKDTISLAFRLAMLEHLYPEGDGIAVFDDPFTDMDPKRVERACRLLRKYAENNQVIFITCDDKYKTLLGGNIIVADR